MSDSSVKKQPLLSVREGFFCNVKELFEDFS